MNEFYYGYAGNDYIDGGLGADRMFGGAGHDTYVVDNAGDLVTENAGEGFDTVRVSFSYTIPLNVERLELTGTAAINATGSAPTTGCTATCPATSSGATTATTSSTAARAPTR